MQPIATTDDLAALCGRLRHEPFVTVDTEFMRDRTYYAQLCLVQLAGAKEAAAVDTLEPGLDLQPLLDLLADPDVLKVMHASRQDMEIFYHLMDRLPAPLFDTQVAAQVLGFGDEVGYETLVTKLAKARLDKSSRFTDWSRRPLSEAQLRYALADVTHLRVIYEKLQGRLERAGRTAWLDAELAKLQEPGLYVQEPDEVWQRLKVRSKEPRFIALVQALASWREKKAQARDLPRARVVRDDILMELAANRPKSVEKLRDMPRLSLDRDSAREVVDTVNEVLARPEADLPPVPVAEPPAKGIGPTVDLLRVLMKHCAEHHDVGLRLIGTTNDLEAIAQDPGADVPLLAGWRFEVFGREALKLIQGRLALAVEGGRVKVIDLDT